MATTKNEVLEALKKAGQKIKGFLGGGKSALNMERALDDGRMLKFATTGDVISDGDGVTMADGSEVPDNVYTLADGQVITVKDGKVVPNENAEPYPLVKALGLNADMSDEDKSKLEAILAENAAKYNDEKTKNEALNAENEEIKAEALALASEVECMPNSLPAREVQILNRADKKQVDEDAESVAEVLARRKAERLAKKNGGK
jgi:hypothetical protein